MADISRELGAEVAGTGDNVFLVHGAAPVRTWGEVPQLIQEGKRVVTYARRSFPPSPGPKPTSYRDHTEDLALLIEEFGSGTVVGWSSGALIAIDLTVRHPGLVNGLVLIEPPLHLKRRPSLSMLRGVVGGIVRGRRNPTAGARHFYGWALRHTNGSNDLDRLDPKELERAAPAIINEISFGTGENEIKLADLSRIDVPAVWLVGADGNPGSLKAAYRAKRHWPGLTIELVPGAAHAIQLSDPEAVVKAVEVVNAEAA